MLPDATAAFALALLRLDGVGRVTAGRLVDRFGTLDAVRSTPREQVLVRLKGLPRAEALVARLHEAEMDDRLAEAETALGRMAERRIAVLTTHHPDWPSNLNDLDESERPVVLYAFGEAAVLRRPLVAFLAPAAMHPEGFETAQALVRRLPERGLVPACGVQHGFDTVVGKLAMSASSPAVLVASAGLARIPPTMRAIAAAVVKAGGVLVSPFPVDHGPFPHDDAERARVLAAMSRAVAGFSMTEDSPELRACRWALDHDRPTFGVARPDGPALPERVHPLDRPADLDWVLAAASPDVPPSGPTS